MKKQNNNKSIDFTDHTMYVFIDQKSQKSSIVKMCKGNACAPDLRKHFEINKQAASKST